MNGSLRPGSSVAVKHPAIVPGFQSSIDFDRDRESLALFLAQNVWAKSGIAVLEHKATTTAIKLTAQSRNPDIATRARTLLESQA